MKLIERKFYLNQMIRIIGTPDIKIITGVRRSGKSKLLQAFEEYVTNNIENSNIISINFNSPIGEQICNYKDLYEYVSSRYKENMHNFLIIDEVQMCDKFEKSVNWLHAEEKYDIYVTGSNAFLLSSDLATLFTGRTFPIEMYPFSFKEYVQYYEKRDVQELFDDYVKEGGFAGAYVYEEYDEKYKYLKDVYDTLIIRDIVKKNNIRNKLLLDSLSDFLMDNISNQTSFRSLAKEYKNNDMHLTDKTIANYINYLCNAFAFYRIRRYDIQGKKYLMSKDKYYLVDPSLKYAKIGTKNINYGRVYENIVAIELLRRGYELYVGELHNKEIDFVATKRDRKIYVQVSDNINDEKTFKREIDSFLQIRDNYPKILIARTYHENYSYEGIEIVDIVNWLLEE